MQLYEKFVTKFEAKMNQCAPPASRPRRFAPRRAAPCARARAGPRRAASGARPERRSVVVGARRLQFVLIVAAIARQFCRSTPPEAMELDSAIAFLERIVKKKRGRIGTEAYVVCKMAQTALVVEKGDDEASLDKAKEAIAEGQALLPELEGQCAEPVANSFVHRVAAEYYSKRGPAAKFYRARRSSSSRTPRSTS